jgi:quercetin dioxygenase-like cupin family protein
MGGTIRPCQKAVKSAVHGLMRNVGDANSAFRGPTRHAPPYPWIHVIQSPCLIRLLERSLRCRAFLGASIVVLGALPLRDLPAQTGTPSHQMKQLSDAVWRAAGPGLAISVLEGDPAVEGKPFAVLLRVDSGAWIPPHWHPNDKRVVVLSGRLLMGQGDSIQPQSVERIGAGGFVVVPARSHHYEGAEGQTTLVLYGTGPLTTTMVSASRRH